MQNGVLNTAHVLIYRQPIIGSGGVQHTVFKIRAGVAGVIPAGFHKGVEGVGFVLHQLAVKFRLAPVGVRLDGD